MKFDKQQVLDFFKTLKFDFLSEPITEVEIETKTYNPFDKWFIAQLTFDNDLLVAIDHTDDSRVEIKWGKDTGWIGGLSHSDVVGRCFVDKLTWESLTAELSKTLPKL